METAAPPLDLAGLRRPLQAPILDLVGMQILFFSFFYHSNF